MRGGKPKAAEVKRKTGSRRQTRPVIIAGRKAPPMPRSLSVEAKAAWKQLVADMTAGGILDASDGPLIEIAASHIGMMRQARKMVAREGAVIIGARGTPVKNPWLLIEQQCSAEVRMLLEQLGVGPVGRSRLGMTARVGRSLSAEINERLGKPGLRLV